MVSALGHTKRVHLSSTLEVVQLLGLAWLLFFLGDETCDGCKKMSAETFFLSIYKEMYSIILRGTSSNSKMMTQNMLVSQQRT